MEQYKKLQLVYIFEQNKLSGFSMVSIFLNQKIER